MPEPELPRRGPPHSLQSRVRMHLPRDGSGTPRAYSEAEFVRILRMAAELQDRVSGAAPAEKLTLAQIEEIAGEVGIEPHHVAAAAALVATEAGEQWNSWLAAPVRGELTRVVPGSLPAPAWQEIASVLRGTLKAHGQHSYVPGALEWVHEHGGSAVRVEVSDSGDHTHVRITMDHREAAAMAALVTPVLGASVAPILAAMLGGGDVVPLWLTITGGAGAGFGLGWAHLRALSTRWQQRARNVLQVLAEVAVTDPDARPHPGDR